ncbi:MAG: 50S ribosomal protein L19 [Candidatus Saccharimonadales bacterium]
MSFELIKKINDAQKKPTIVDVKSGDTVRVYQKIKEGAKERIQMFEGVVLRTDRMNSHTARITVRKVASGVGVEKSFLMHSPLVEKVVVVKRSKVRRNFLGFLRNRSGKGSRLKGVKFDRESINDVHDAAVDAEEARLKELAHQEAEAKLAEKEAAEAELAAKQAEVAARHNEEI